MIFVALGSQKFQFDRLLKAVDELVASGEITEEVFAQSGSSTYQPRHYPCEPFLDAERFADCMARADIVITHGGTGAIIRAVKLGKRVIVVPRLARYGEHVDDHQLQIMSMFDELQLALPCEDLTELSQQLVRIRSMTFRTYQSNTQTLIDSIDGFIQSL
ncbi:MAG: beta(1,3)galactosyltransferase EpsH [Clostridia bacterium]|nr:beta(1,3)galactosyltransferase EpsH [Clostridia bacterium]